MKRSGFTLIELLVVIAIIAILAAILFPVFARARAKAQQSNCLSNTKQITLGLIMYASDYDEKYPIPSFADAGGNTYYWWNGVDPYIKNFQIWRCPSDATAGMIADNPGATPPFYPRSYYSNSLVITNPPFSTGSIAASAQCILLPEAAQRITGVGTAGMNGSDWAWVVANQTGGTNYWVTQDGYYQAMIRHNQGQNMGFCDGHAKWYNVSAVPGVNVGNVDNGTARGIWWDPNFSG
ncbi:MAG TPA: prepilin-type N-terminal cleavage/methylation domain-containing protein [Armatimonadota bacterium]|jgi:prepilin-type N-terminal cleavage/methylation domain-containing protein/prepilin-type processing-associated H-X9-DG protein